MGSEQRARAVKGYDETLVSPRGFTVHVRESFGSLTLRIEFVDVSHVYTAPLAPHEARQIASLLRHGTELDYLPHRSCDEALASAREERDRLIDCGQAAELGCAEAPGCLRCFGREVEQARAERDRLRVRVSELEALTDAAEVGAEMDRLLARILDVQADAARTQDERDRLHDDFVRIADAVGLVSTDDTGRIGDVGTVDEVLVAIQRAVSESHATVDSQLAYDEASSERDRLRRELESLRAHVDERAKQHERMFRGEAEAALREVSERIDAILTGEGEQ